MLGHRRKGECVVYWYSFSNPRTKCIHCDNCLVIKKKRVLSFPPQILADLSSRVSAQFDPCHLDSSTLPAYLCWIGGHVLTKAIILSSLCMFLSHIPRGYVCMYVYMHVCVCLCTCVCVCVYGCVIMCVRAYITSHTQTLSLTYTPAQPCR
jgi:hypothetical protein